MCNTTDTYIVWIKQIFVHINKRFRFVNISCFFIFNPFDNNPTLKIIQIPDFISSLLFKVK